MSATFGYHKMFRPQEWGEIRGNQAVAKSFEQMLNKEDGPRVFLITGNSGCGKTTIARIAAKHLGCEGLPNLTEYNAADDRGIELVRTIKESVRYAAMGNRCHIIDEAHQLTPQAQEAFLKVLEDGPSSDYFFICTTNPENFKKTFTRRCQNILIKPLKSRDIAELIEDVIDEERLDVADTVLDKIIDVADGSPAIALNALQSVAELDEKLALEKLDDEGNMAVMDQSESVGNLIKAVFWGKQSKKEVLEMIAAMKKEGKDSPEGIRLALVNCAGNNLLGGGKGAKRNLDVLDHMLDEPQLFLNKSQDWAVLAWKINEIMS